MTVPNAARARPTTAAVASRLSSYHRRFVSGECSTCTRIAPSLPIDDPTPLPIENGDLPPTPRRPSRMMARAAKTRPARVRIDPDRPNHAHSALLALHAALSATHASETIV